MTIRTDGRTRTLFAVAAALTAIALMPSAALAKAQSKSHAKGGLSEQEVEAIVERRLEEERAQEQRVEEEKAAERKVKVTEDGLTFVSSGFWKMSIGGLLQAWYQYTDDAPNPTYGFTNPDAHNTFRIRRAEMNFKGSYRDKLKFYVMIDPAKNLFQNQTLSDSAGNTMTVQQPRSDSSILQNLELTFGYIPYHEVTIGQMKIPVSLEGQGSSAKLAFAERAIVSRTFGDKRDIGLMITGKPIPEIQYEVGVFNGEGPNQLDQADFKDIAGRITIRPIKGLLLAGEYYRGRIGDPEQGNYRTGGEFRYERGRFFTQGEFLRGYGSVCGTGIKCQGAYGYVGGDIWKTEDFTLQAVARFEFFDPNLGAGNDIQYASTAGLNLLPPDYHAKVQLNYTETEMQGTGRNNVVFVAAQFAL